MHKEDQLSQIQQAFEQFEEQPLEVNPSALQDAYAQPPSSQSLGIKIVSIVGGLLASQSFFGSLFTTGLYENQWATFILGVVCVLAAILIRKKTSHLLFDTVSVTTYLIGLVNIIISLLLREVEATFIPLITLTIGVIMIISVQDYLLSFFSLLVITSSLFTFLLMKNWPGELLFFVGLISLFTTFWYLNEATLLTKFRKRVQLYTPFRIGLLFSCIAGYALVIHAIDLSTRSLSLYYWLTAVVLLGCLGYVLYKVIKLLSINSTRLKIGYALVGLILLSTTLLSFPLTGALLLVFLNYYVNYRTGFVISILALLYAIGLYYYDLEFTLLVKSVLLMSSGCLFIALYFFTRKKLIVDETL